MTENISLYAGLSGVSHSKSLAGFNIELRETLEMFKTYDISAFQGVTIK